MAGDVWCNTKKKSGSEKFEPLAFLDSMVDDASASRERLWCWNAFA